jgi:hypothetical protein
MALADGVALPKVQVAGASDQGLVIVACIEKASLRSLKVSDHRLRQLLGCHEPFALKGGLVRLQQALDEVGVILQVAVELGFAPSFSILRTSFPGTQ